MYFSKIYLRLLLLMYIHVFTIDSSVLPVNRYKQGTGILLSYKTLALSVSHKEFHHFVTNNAVIL